jgi:methylenetetrahydrofolate--tRNA-(uracil-5-)-methyltransferase
MSDITIIGGGLAGCEAAWQLANRGLSVLVIEMRPERMTPAHTGGDLAELVCSNSLGAVNPYTPSGLLKSELRALNSLIMACADQTRVPAGDALAVDRSLFAQLVTAKISGHPNIRLRREHWTQFPSAPAIIATGPLTDGEFAQTLKSSLGEDMLSFFDAAAPIIFGESINFSKVFRASRYGKGGADYLNCPLSKEEYQTFYRNLIEAETVDLKEFEGSNFFEHCLPVEVIAKRGPKTLTFGPMKPVGLQDPCTGRQPYAVAQLRREDIEGELYNLVGFQTNLTWKEQKRVLRLIPGLENADFARFGVMHRNTYINGPKIFGKNYQLQAFPGRYIAGQLAGVEGYLESTMSGLVAALDLWGESKGISIDFPRETLSGSLTNYVSRDNVNFQPMNANFGLLPPLRTKGSKKQRREEYVERGKNKLFLFAKDLLC